MFENLSSFPNSARQPIEVSGIGKEVCLFEKRKATTCLPTPDNNFSSYNLNAALHLQTNRAVNFSRLGFYSDWVCNVTKHWFFSIRLACNANEIVAD